MGQDTAKAGQDKAKMGPMLAVMLLMLCETCFLKNGCFALARAPFWGSAGRPDGAMLAYVGLSLDLYWLKLATVGRKVAYVGPMLGLCWPKSGLGGLPGAHPQ